MDILEEAALVLANAQLDQEADRDLNIIRDALEAKYRQSFSDLTALEIFFEDLEAFHLPYSDNAIFVVPSRVMYGAVDIRVRHHLDAFLKTASGITLLESAELEED